MLDAFIIEEIQKREDEKQWRPVSLPLELPLPVYEDYAGEKEDKDKPAKELVFRF